MHQLKLTVIAALLLLTALPVQAQENLLVNGGLEEGAFGPYQGRGRGDLNIPAGWDIWLAQGSTDQFYNRGDKVYAFPSSGPEPTPIEGQSIANIHGGYITFTVAMYQTVSVAPGTNLTAEASSYLISCTLDDDDEFGKCASDPASGAQTRVGIDPDGGSDPNAPEIIWSGWASGHDFWANMQTQATATGGSATIFLYMTQATVQQNNFAYWDNAKLYAGGEGGAAPAAVNDTTTASTTDITGTSAIAPVATPFPTVAPRPRVQYAPFVVPQADTNTDEEQVEITHTVQTGDTFDAIAYAYGLTRDDLLEINPNIGSIRFLRIGQTIIVQPASTPEVTATEEAPVATEEPATPAG